MLLGKVRKVSLVNERVDVSGRCLEYLQNQRLCEFLLLIVFFNAAKLKGEIICFFTLVAFDSGQYNQLLIAAEVR